LQNYRWGYGGIALPNEPSIRLHKSIGFKFMAEFPGACWRKEELQVGGKKGGVRRGESLTTKFATDPTRLMLHYLTFLLTRPCRHHPTDIGYKFNKWISTYWLSFDLFELRERMEGKDGADSSSSSTTVEAPIVFTKEWIADNDDFLKTCFDGSAWSNAAAAAASASSVSK